MACLSWHNPIHSVFTNLITLPYAETKHCLNLRPSNDSAFLKDYTEISHLDFPGL